MMSSGKQQSRDYLFDNYKVLLIALVVMGHFIELSYRNNDFLYTVKWLIVSFHMPAFIFISGYFSKRDLPLKTLIQKLLIPYLVYELLYYTLYTFIIEKPTELYLLYPKFSLWYIQALFFWRLLTPVIRRIPGYMILSVIAGLLVGCSDMPGNLLSIPRTLVFFPFFLAGTRFDRSLLTRFRTRKNQWLSGIFIVSFVLFLILEPGHKALSPKIFYGRYNYDYLGQTALEGILCRLFCYATGFAMTFAIALLISEKRLCCSFAGSRTMAIYLFHGLTYSFLKGSSNILSGIDTITGSILLLGFCVLLTAIFSLSPFTRFTNMVSGLTLPGKRKQVPKTDDFKVPKRRFLPGNLLPQNI